MFAKLFVVALAVAYVAAGAVEVRDCGSTAQVTEVRIDGCDRMPCQFYKGNIYAVEADATTNVATSSLRYRVTARIIFEITLLEGDACLELTVGACPLNNGDNLTFRIEVNVQPTFPTISTTVKAMVSDDRNSQIVCKQVDVEVRPSPFVQMRELVAYMSHK